MTPSDPVQRLERGPRLIDQVVERLREMIGNGELQPGASLIQDELAATVGISRTPVREALRILERDGLVEFLDNNRAHGADPARTPSTASIDS